MKTRDGSDGAMGVTNHYARGRTLDKMPQCEVVRNVELMRGSPEYQGFAGFPFHI
jgi:hypothetical protein